MTNGDMGVLASVTTFWIAKVSSARSQKGRNTTV